ncbi:16S rRNA (uracil(1498)-N(3))-methyltransferase [Shouchella shacheensis]|uniref:16S rRNA (uracil(1498)-N(3))-methyltransferase n=1 Tax=Shouchella shacheensis TaxID=1649580 RepID=UPI0007402F32|nr:16S rRNA (uracil(1498)-N(3))-methyltransferase [Shouchella shacheensis]
MQRYFVSDEQMTEGCVKVHGDDAAHIARVMRMQTGDAITCLNEQGRAVIAKLADVSTEMVRAEIIREIEMAVELPISVTIAQGLPKGDKLEQVIQKSTELGASCFLPFIASRSVVKWDAKKASKKRERLQKIAKEAAEQSHRQFVPTVESLTSFSALLELSTSYDAILVCDEEEAKAGESKQLASTFARLHPDNTLLVVIGPEGGLTREEASALHAVGAHSCALGPRILRTETAPLYLLAALSYHFE